jgi:hypothetical protein
MQALLEPFNHLVNDFPSTAAKSNLAMFSSRGSCHLIQVPAPIPTVVECGFSYFLEPLIEARGQLHQYFAVVIKADDVKLYFGDVNGLSPLVTPEFLESVSMPKSGFSSADWGYPKSHNGGEGDVYLDRVTATILNMLRNRPAKILLFGPARLTSKMAAQFVAPNQVVEIAGSARHLPIDRLHALAWSEVLRMESQSRQVLLNELEASLPCHRVTGVQATLGAARNGQLSRLFIREGNKGGELDSSEEAAIATLRFGGEITVCPSRTLTQPLAGVLRNQVAR